MGFWDRKVGETGAASPQPRPGGPPARPQAPPRAAWPSHPPQPPRAAPAANQDPFETHQDFEEEITPETHPWAFQMGPDGRLQRSVWTWRGNRRGAASMAGVCPNCGSGNYIPPVAADDGWHGGNGASSAGVTNVKTGQKVQAAPRCQDCGYPKLQQGSGASLSGNVVGRAPSAGVGGFRPVAAVGKFDSSVGKYVKIGD